jgi:hypothetical protein
MDIESKLGLGKTPPMGPYSILAVLTGGAAILFTLFIPIPGVWIVLSIMSVILSTITIARQERLGLIGLCLALIPIVIMACSMQSSATRYNDSLNELQNLYKSSY